MLKIRPVHYCRLLWIDFNLANEENKGYLKTLSNEFEEVCFATADNINDAIGLINSTVKTVIIVSG